jgi:uncharacterized membrane protein YcaP (DUF421 family)
MFTLATPLWDIVLRTAAVYAVILVGLRLSGKREIGQMTVFDLVVLLLLANSVQNAMLGPDSSLAGGLVAALVLLTINAVMARMRLRWPGLRRALEGSPTLLVLRGKLIEEHLRREGLDQEIVQAALREHGIADLEDVDIAVLEIDGSISVVPAGSVTRRFKRPPRRPRQS